MPNVSNLEDRCGNYPIFTVVIKSVPRSKSTQLDRKTVIHNKQVDNVCFFDVEKMLRITAELKRNALNNS